MAGLFRTLPYSAYVASIALDLNNTNCPTTKILYHYNNDPAGRSSGVLCQF